MFSALCKIPKNLRTGTGKILKISFSILLNLLTHSIYSKVLTVPFPKISFLFWGFFSGHFNISFFNHSCVWKWLNKKIIGKFPYPDNHVFSKPVKFYMDQGIYTLNLKCITVVLQNISLECFTHKLTPIKNKENTKARNWYPGWVEALFSGNRVGRMSQAGTGTWILNLELNLIHSVTFPGSPRIIFLYM